MQLNTIYQEVTEEQLRTHIRADKVEAVEGRSARSQGQRWVHGSAAVRALSMVLSVGLGPSSTSGGR